MVLYKEFTDDPVDVLGSIDDVLVELHRLYCVTKNRVARAFNNREVFIGRDFDQYPESEMLDSALVESYLYARVYEEMYYLLEDCLDSDYNVDSDWEEGRAGYNPNEVVVKPTVGGELTGEVERVDDYTIRAVGLVELELPMPVDLLLEFDNSAVVIRRVGDGEYETELVVSGLNASDTAEDSGRSDGYVEYDSQLVEYLYRADVSLEEKEAYALSMVGVNAIRVAVGDRAVAECYTDLELIEYISSFPISKFEWENDVGGSTFVYNTELASEAELREELSDIDRVSDSDNTRVFGEFLGYPEYAIEAYSEKISAGESPGYYNDVLLYYSMIEGESLLSYEELNWLERLSYVIPFDVDTESEEFQESLVRGREVDELLESFVQEYGVPDADELLEWSYPENPVLYESFDEMWRVPEVEPNFEFDVEESFEHL